MENTSENGLQLAGASKRLAQRMFIILENRLQLLMVEAQEERERILLAIWLALGAAVFGLLAGISLTAVIAVALWEHSPVVVILVCAMAYAAAAAFLCVKLNRLQRDWQTFSGTLEQLKKDRECLEKNLI
jgi:uncharacterized membrane protein YqjE